MQVPQNHFCIISLGSLCLGKNVGYNFIMDLEEAIKLWCTVDPYRDYPCSTIAWRLLPASHHGRLRHYWDCDRYVGFVSWAFLSSDEYMTNSYDGLEIFARTGGDRLVIIDMIANGGSSDVRVISRDLRRFFYLCYPDYGVVWSHRGDRYGWYKNRGP